MFEKVYERRVKLDKKDLLKLVDRRVKELQQEQAQNCRKYEIRYRWNRQKGTLDIKHHLGTVVIFFQEGGIEAHADISFFLLPFKSKGIEIIRAEIQKLLGSALSPVKVQSGKL